MPTEHQVAGAGWEESRRLRRSAVLAPGDVVEALEELGVTFQVSGHEIVAECPYHPEILGRPDRKLGSFKINAETGLNRCYSCGGRGSFARFVASYRGVPLEEGQRFVAARGASVLQREKRRPTQRRRTATGYGDVSEAKLVLFDDPPEEELYDRRITPEAAARYRIRWDPKMSAWILPIRDADGVLMGWQYKTRRIVRNHPPRKGREPGVELKDVLFGWAERDPDQPLLVVESPLDVARLRSVDLNAVGTYGAEIADGQQRLLMTHEQLICLCLDADDAGATATIGLIEGHNGRERRPCGPMLGRTRGPLRVADLYAFPRRSNGKWPKDPGDLDDDECLTLLPDALTAREASRLLTDVG